MADGGHLEEPIWDGNGGTLDPRKATQRDMLVALHVKMDNVVIPKLTELETRMRRQEDGDLTRGQEAAVRGMLTADSDARLERRSLKTPVWALIISCAALVASIVYTVAAISGGTL